MHAMRMLVPPAWQSVDMITIRTSRPSTKSTTPRTWSPGTVPQASCSPDGRYVCCTLDRNGLRPARWVITKNRHITVASKRACADYQPEDVVRKGKLGPGEMLALDLQTGELLMDTKRVDELLKNAVIPTRPG